MGVDNLKWIRIFISLLNAFQMTMFKMLPL